MTDMARGAIRNSAGKGFPEKNRDSLPGEIPDQV